jgi:hypothetical protein
MKHAVTRVLSVAVFIVLALVLPSSPAGAADADLGWVRLQPATGTTDIAVLALTERACPDGRAVTMSLDGPNIPDDNSVGNLVGVTEYRAFEETLSGQLWIPLSTTFRNWFMVNGVTLAPGKPYTLTVVCRDLLRASKTFGTFTAQVVFDAKGGYKALGEAAEPFDTELKPDDPLAIPTPTSSGVLLPDDGRPSPSVSGEPSAGSSAPADPTDIASSEPAVDGSDGSGSSDAPGGGSTTVASPAGPTGPSGTSPLPFVVLGLAAAGGAAWFLQRRRTATAAVPTGRRERPPTDEL